MLTLERFSIMWTEEHRITSVNQLQVKYNEKRNSIQGKVHRGWQSLTRFSRFVMSISTAFNSEFF